MLVGQKEEHSACKNFYFKAPWDGR